MNGEGCGFRTALLRERSKSMNVSAGQSRCRSSSRDDVARMFEEQQEDPMLRHER